MCSITKQSQSTETPLFHRISITHGELVDSISAINQVFTIQKPERPVLKWTLKDRPTGVEKRVSRLQILLADLKANERGRAIIAVVVGCLSNLLTWRRVDSNPRAVALNQDHPPSALSTQRSN